MRNLLINWLKCCVIVLCLVLCLTPLGCANPNKDRWTKTNTALQAAFLATTAVDYYQSAQPNGIVDRCREWHPIVGECGDRGGIGGVFALTALTHTAIASSLDTKWRLIFQSFTLGVEMNVVFQNYQAGYGIFGYKTDW